MTHISKQHSCHRLVCRTERRSHFQPRTPLIQQSVKHGHCSPADIKPGWQVENSSEGTFMFNPKVLLEETQSGSMWGKNAHREKDSRSFIVVSFIVLWPFNQHDIKLRLDSVPNFPPVQYHAHNGSNISGYLFVCDVVELEWERPIVLRCLIPINEFLLYSLSAIKDFS